MRTNSENRDAFHTTRFTQFEAADVLAAAAASGVSVSALIRARVCFKPLPKPPAPELNLICYQDLQKVGNNLNQIAHQLNRSAQVGDAPPSIGEVLARVEEVFDAVNKVRLLLIGAGK